jgi:DeoR family transcriptional regulator, deoxyribose operon repressor
MNRQSRLESLQAIIINVNSATLKDLAEQLNVSTMTVRRDMDILEEAGLVKIYRGGVIVAEHNTYDSRAPLYSLSAAAAEHIKEKQAIAKLAASTIEPDDVIFLDSGSTVEGILNFIDPLMKLTIICYSLNILNRVADRKNANIIFLGGVYHPDSQCCESPEGLTLLNRKRSSRAFISADGIHIALGVTTPGVWDSPFKHAGMKNSAHTYLLADSSKCGLVRTGHFADIEDFNTVISDNDFPEDMREYLTEKGIEMMFSFPD